jgi:hypothetical protein
MAKPPRQEPKDGQVTFTRVEVEALRTIVSDWIQEEIVAPPYPSGFITTFEKLGIDFDAAMQDKGRAARKRATALEETPEIEELDPGRTPPLRPNLG